MTPHKNIVEALNCLALPDTPCIHGVKFPLCSYGFLEKNKNSRFLIKTSCRNLEKHGEVLKDFMLTFNLHVNGQCLKNSHWFYLKILFLKIAYMYLAHICVLRDYVGFRYKNYMTYPKSLKYPLKFKIKVFII